MIVALIVGLVIGILVGSLIVTIVLMPTLGIMVKDNSGFGYVFNTVLPAMIVGSVANLAIEFAMSSAQGVEFGEAAWNWFNWPITLIVMTFFINKRHEASVVQSFLAALITQIVLVVLAVIIALIFS